MTTDAELRALAEAATPGPWRHSGATVWAPVSPDDPTDYSGEAVAYVPTLGDEFDADDAAYIAAMSPDVALALIDRLKRAEAALSVERIAEALVPVLRCWPPAVSERELERDRRDMLEIAGRLLAALKGDSE